MSNVAPEHGPGPNVPTRTGPGLPASGGSRPPKPNADAYGSVTTDGPTSMDVFNPPADNDADDPAGY